MTTVIVFRAPDGSISGFDTSGHTGYADMGEDIVCAAVSALTQATLNGLLNVLRAPVKHEMDEEGARLAVSLGRDFPSDKREGAQLLLETLVSGLQSIEMAYPGFVRVIFKERR
jgi:uncharacterized protein YsxB (DUF464 family)